MSDPSSSDRPIKGVKADWSEVVLVCRKCSKKLDGGFGEDGDQNLAKALRKAIGAKGKGRKAPNRKARAAVIEVDCLDVCPKGAVVAVRPRKRGRWFRAARRSRAWLSDWAWSRPRISATLAAWTASRHPA